MKRKIYFVLHLWTREQNKEIWRLHAHEIAEWREKKRTKKINENKWMCLHQNITNEHMKTKQNYSVAHIFSFFLFHFWFNFSFRCRRHHHRFAFRCFKINEKCFAFGFPYHSFSLYHLSLCFCLPFHFTPDSSCFSLFFFFLYFCLHFFLVLRRVRVFCLFAAMFQNRVIFALSTFLASWLFTYRIRSTEYNVYICKLTRVETIHTESDQVQIFPLLRCRQFYYKKWMRINRMEIFFSYPNWQFVEMFGF